jgi:hypothetical protein
MDDHCKGGIHLDGSEADEPVRAKARGTPFDTEIPKIESVAEFQQALDGAYAGSVERAAGSDEVWRDQRGRKSAQWGEW